MAVTASESHFDAQARTWDESPMRLALSAAVAAGVWDALRPAADAHLLEFGCGTGLVGLRLADRIGHLTAADRSGAMLEVLAGKASDLGFSNVRCGQSGVSERSPPPAPRTSRARCGSGRGSRWARAES